MPFLFDQRIRKLIKIANCKKIYQNIQGGHEWVAG